MLRGFGATHATTSAFPFLYSTNGSSFQDTSSFPARSLHVSLRLRLVDDRDDPERRGPAVRHVPIDLLAHGEPEESDAE